MHAILYRSTATSPVSPADIARMVDVAARRNALWCITGLLLHGIDADGRHGFAQWLEGDAEGLESLFALICADHRHTDVVRIADGRDLACYALPTSRQAMWAIDVGCLPVTVEEFLICVAAHLDLSEPPALHE